MKLKNLLFVLLFFYYGAANSPVGFVHLPADAVTMGMAEINTVLRSSTAATIFNPAAIAGWNHMALSFSHTEMYAGLNKEYISFIIPGQKAALGSCANILYTDKRSEVFTDDNLNSFKDVQIALAGAFNFIKKPSLNLAAGINCFYLQEPFIKGDSSAFAFSAGLSAAVKTPSRRLKPYPVYNLIFGAAVRNLGGDLKLGQEKYTLPLSAAAGVSYAPVSFFKLAAEGRLFKNKEPELAVALESFLNTPVRPRLGFIWGKDNPSKLTAGIGTEFRSGRMLVSLHYAANFLTDFEMMHYFTVNLGYRTVEKQSPEHNELPLGPLGISRSVKKRVAAELADDRNLNDTDNSVTRIAIFPFLNISGSESTRYIGKTINDNLKYEFNRLAPAQKVSIQDISFIKRVLTKLGLRPEQITKKKAVIELARITGADLVIYGTYEELEDSLYCNYNILDMETEAVLKRKHASAKIVKNFFSFLDKIAGKIFVDIKGILDHN
ncbi:MAG TPA: FlgO family outer membrane protein [Spirochaetota bacterium]|nr:FlgO family outer membrane protein [Spirochaetota bacterium]